MLDTTNNGVSNIVTFLSDVRDHYKYRGGVALGTKVYMVPFFEARRLRCVHYQRRCPDSHVTSHKAFLF